MHLPSIPKLFVRSPVQRNSWELDLRSHDRFWPRRLRLLLRRATHLHWISRIPSSVVSKSQVPSSLSLLVSSLTGYKVWIRIQFICLVDNCSWIQTAILKKMSLFRAFHKLHRMPATSSTGGESTLWSINSIIHLSKREISWLVMLIWRLGSVHKELVKSKCSVVSGQRQHKGQRGSRESFRLFRLSRVGKLFWHKLHVKNLTFGRVFHLQMLVQSELGICQEEGGWLGPWWRVGWMS